MIPAFRFKHEWRTDSRTSHILQLQTIPHSASTYISVIRSQLAVLIADRPVVHFLSISQLDGRQYTTRDTIPKTVHSDCIVCLWSAESLLPDKDLTLNEDVITRIYRPRYSSLVTMPVGSVW